MDEANESAWDRSLADEDAQQVDSAKCPQTERFLLPFYCETLLYLRPIFYADPRQVLYSYCQSSSI